jgi:hypothetical protein
MNVHRGRASGVLQSGPWVNGVSAVSWGQPRQAVMLAYDLPRSTANQWILKARDLYDLPGPHADSDDGED